MLYMVKSHFVNFKKKYYQYIRIYKYRHGDCCCKWLVPDYSEFSFKFTKNFDQKNNKHLWTCGEDCNFGFICSK